MNDTRLDVVERYAAMFRALTPAERLAMGARMLTCARALMRAGILASLGEDADEGEIRRSMFLRLYGDELAEPHRSRALRAVLEGGTREPGQ